MSDSIAQLERVFGPGEGTTAAERARRSERQFIRGLDQLSPYQGRGKGRRLTALEALEAYGFDVLTEAAAEGSVLMCYSPSAAGDVLRDRRTQLGLTLRHVANQAGVVQAQVEAAERSSRLPIKVYERIARSLALDERYLSVRPEPTENERVALRLRTVGRNVPAMTASVVSALAEAAWVGARQLGLEGRLALSPKPTGIRENPSYGKPGFPAYAWGYHLARDARRHLSLNQAPIESLRELAEEQLGFPVIQAELGPRIAGATLEFGQCRRALVINVSGRNRHVYMRRSTIAHELGHLLYDPSTRLTTLRVDQYHDLDARPEGMTDPVEQRANAFSAELLAPQGAALALYQAGGDDPLGNVIRHFGISFTAARYQVWNGLERKVPLDSLVAEDTRPPDHWEAREAFTVDYHPIRCIRTSRAGRFSAVVVRAAEERLISWDTVIEWLEADETDLERARRQLPELYPSVFKV